MPTATAAPRPATSSTQRVGLYGRPRRRCQHSDEKTGKRCVTLICELNPDPDFCFRHSHLTRDKISDTLAGIAEVMRQRTGMAG